MSWSVRNADGQEVSTLSDAYEPLDGNDSQELGWVVGKRYRIWTGDVDLVLGYAKGWVVVQDVKTGQIRSHLTRLDHTDREVPKLPHELCESCKATYDSYSDMSPETARALKRQGVSATDLIRRQQLSIRETCTAAH